MKLNKEQIEWLNECTFGSWTLNKKTGLVDINGYFNCSSKKLKDFKGVKFGVVEGSFYCDYNSLTSLEGAPKEVKRGFSCPNNSLTSLVGSPQVVGGSFRCSNNSLTSLEGAPKEVGGSFYCQNNSLTSLEGAPQEVGRDFYCDNNSLTSLEGAPKVVGGDFDCSNNPISEKTLNFIYLKMKQEKKLDYYSILLLLEPKDLVEILRS